MTLIFAGGGATETQTINLQSRGKISFHRAVGVPTYVKLSDLCLLLYNSYSVMKSTDIRFSFNRSKAHECISCYTGENEISPAEVTFIALKKVLHWTKELFFTETILKNEILICVKLT